MFWGHIQGPSRFRGIRRGPNGGTFWVILAVLDPDAQSLYARARTMIVPKMPFY